MSTKLEKERDNMLAKLSENEQNLFEQVYKRLLRDTSYPRLDCTPLT